MPQISDRRIIHSAYFHSCLTAGGIRKRVAMASIILRPFQQHFQAIAYRGESGGLVAPALAMTMKKNLIMVRKRTDNCHSNQIVEGSECDGYVIVDDLICHGDTIKDIVKKVTKSDIGRAGAKLVGIAFYMDNNSPHTLQTLANEYGVWVVNPHPYSPFHPKLNTTDTHADQETSPQVPDPQV